MHSVGNLVWGKSPKIEHWLFLEWLPYIWGSIHCKNAHYPALLHVLEFNFPVHSFLQLFWYDLWPMTMCAMILTYTGHTWLYNLSTTWTASFILYLVFPQHLPSTVLSTNHHIWSQNPLQYCFQHIPSPVLPLFNEEANKDQLEAWNGPIEAKLTVEMQCILSKVSFHRIWPSFWGGTSYL